jgi:SAM-dependent methyltransferase
MHRSLLPILTSPCCHETLRIWPESVSDTASGELTCTGCLRCFPIREGVPDLVLDPARALQQSSFAYQWKMRLSGNAEPEHVLWGNDMRLLPVKLKGAGFFYLDCGCGTGQTLRAVALENPGVQVVGVDISDVVYAAWARDRDIPNIHYVRSDALNPPFVPGCFRYVLALGVLHHTGDTRGAVLATLNLLQKRGCASVWLYPELDDLRKTNAAKEYRKWKRYYALRDRLFLGHSHLIPHSVLHVLCHLLSAVLSPFGHLLNAPVRGLHLRYRSNLFLLFDNLAARWQDRPRKQAVLEWFREAGIFKVVHSFERGGIYTGLKA